MEFKTGKLRKNDIGRWEIVFEDASRYELTSGDVDEFYVVKTWCSARVEHNGKDYYPFGLHGVHLYAGMPARIPA